MPASSSTTRMEAVAALPLTGDSGAGVLKGRSSSVMGSGMDRIPRQRKLKMKRCAGADGAFDVDLSCMLLNDAVGDGKTQAGTALVARLCLGGEEGIVDALEVLGRDT